MTIKENIANILNTYPIGKDFTMNDLYNDGLQRADSTGRRLRELREVGWEVPFIGNKYKLVKKGAMPSDKEWTNGRKEISQKIRRQVFERDSRKCVICGIRSNKSELTIGHIIPVALGGTNDWNNLRSECVKCNEPWRDHSYDTKKRLLELKEKHFHIYNKQSKLSVIEKKELLEMILLDLKT